MTNQPNRDIYIWQREKSTLTVGGLLNALEKYPKELPVWVYADGGAIRLDLNSDSIVLEPRHNGELPAHLQIQLND